MKRLNRLLLLGFLGVLGAQFASAQALTSVRIGTNEEGAKFLVDGQAFLYTQNFVWPEGSTHSVEFPVFTDIGDAVPYQYHPSGRARYIFNGWTPTSRVPVQLQPGYSVQPGAAVFITASRDLTELLGTVTKQFPFDIEFSYSSPANGCTTEVEVQNIDRRGVILVDGICVAKNTTIWMIPGVHSFQAVAYPGYYFRGASFANVYQAYPAYFTRTMTDTTHFDAYFEKAKRVRFGTNPPGLQILVDRTPITPHVNFTRPLYTDYCEDYTLNIKVPLGVDPLCIGDFDFAPGSSHVLSSAKVQSDPQGDFWIFDHFSNGLGQNGTYVTPNNVYVRDDIQAIYVHGVRSSIDSNVSGLKIGVDGEDVAPNPYYGFVWAEGSTHRLKPPALQRDSKGRVWKFVRWSDGGEPEHDVKVPVGGGDFRVTAFFEVLGQVQVSSTPPGLTVKVNGADCTTPCSFDQEPGAMLNIEAPKHIALGEASRYDFDAWAGRTNALTQEATFTSDVQQFVAQYHGSHRLLAYSDPDGGAKFTFSPESTDGFYPEGTSVEVTVVPNTGFKFLIWDQDLISKSATDHLTITGPSSVVAKLEKVPAIAKAGIRNAAGDTPDGTVAPGSIISIYGENLTEELEIGPSNPLAQAIGNIYVTVNDSLLPLIFISPKQINAQLLSGLVDGEYTLKVHNTGHPDVSAAFTVKRNSPGVFYNVTQDGMPLVAALHQDGTPISQESPARKGETISFFGTGLGSYDRPIVDGFILPGTEVYNLLDPVKILAGVPQPEAREGETAAVAQPVVRDPAFAGGAAGMVGTSLIRVKLDSDLPAGKTLELTVSVNGSQSNKVQLPVE
jgi:uncharacterized protein (TIGR03437 family)